MEDCAPKTGKCLHHHVTHQLLKFSENYVSYYCWRLVLQHFTVIYNLFRSTQNVDYLESTDYTLQVPVIPALPDTHNAMEQVGMASPPQRGDPCAHRC